MTKLNLRMHKRRRSSTPIPAAAVISDECSAQLIFMSKALLLTSCRNSDVSGNSSDGCRLRCCGRLSIRRQRLHLLMALTQVEDFDASRWVNLVHSITRRATSFSVQIVALNEHRMIAEASQPNIAFAAQIKLNAFSYVKAEREKINKISCDLNRTLTELSRFVLSDGRCSMLLNRSDCLPKDRHSRRP